MQNASPFLKGKLKTRFTTSCRQSQEAQELFDQLEDEAPPPRSPIPELEFEEPSEEEQSQEGGSSIAGLDGSTRSTTKCKMKLKTEEVITKLYEDAGT